MLKNTSTTYGSVAKILHWLSALLIIGITIAGFIMTRLDPSDQKWLVYGMHKAFGIITLVLIPLRIIWRLANLQPSLPHTLPRWQSFAADANILFLYICMVIMPLSGFLMSTFGGHAISMFGLLTIEPFEKTPEIAGNAHQTHMLLAWGITASIGIHVLGAFYHHFIQRDDVLKRMLPGNK